MVSLNRLGLLIGVSLLLLAFSVSCQPEDPSSTTTAQPTAIGNGDTGQNGGIVRPTPTTGPPVPTPLNRCQPVCLTASRSVANR